MTTSLLSPASTGSAVLSADLLRLAISAYLGRFKGSSREHTESDMRVFLTWCVAHGVQPLAAQRADLELYVRWMQETRRFKPSTVSRRISVLAGFYRTCVIDDVSHRAPLGAAVHTAAGRCRGLPGIGSATAGSSTGRS